MFKNNLIRKFKNSFLKKIILFTPIFGILYFEIYYKLYFPITDDWLYVPWGSHQISPGNISDFELVSGHQQVITKYTIWLLGFAPKFYLPYVGFLNFSFAVAGYLLLIASSIKYIGKQLNFVYLFSFFIIAFSFKPFYMYMTATALGPMQAIFFIGLYYYIKNHPKKYMFGLILVPVIFLSPFTTGLGMIIPMTEILENLYRFIRNKYLARNNILRFFAAILGLIFAYAWPMITKNLNSRAMPGDISLIHNIFGSLSNPLGIIKFILTLMGSILTPSSRYDPILPMALGFLFLSFLFLFLFKKIQRNDIEDIFLNKNSILGGLCFFTLLIFNRFGGLQSEIIGAAAPRYVTGYIVFLLGIFSLLIRKNYHKKLFVFMLILFCFLVFASGLKTGLEWQKIRFSQTQTVVKCISEDLKHNKNISDSCINLAFQLGYANIDFNTFNHDLNNYLVVSKQLP